MTLNHRLTGALLAMILTAASGCQSGPTRSMLTRSEKPPTGAVSNAVVVWSEAVLRNSNQPVAQGFTAKVYLYGPEGKQPITAPGKFTIYAYDEPATTGTDGVRQVGLEEHHVKPDKTWEFPESQIHGLLKKDLIGWGYSLWLPYGLPSSTERRCSLMLTFTPEQAQGPRAVSESTLVTLPALPGSRPTGIAQKSSGTQN